MVRKVLALGLALVANACASQAALRSDAYYNDRYAYRVTYIAPGALAGPDWTLDNFQTDEAGRPTTPKKGPDYRTDFRADTDGDGKLEAADEVNIYDLHFIHKKTAATLWLSTVPISQTHAQTELTVLARAFVQAVSGTGLRARHLGDGVATKERTFATRILAEKSVTVDGMPGHRVTFELASVHQLELDPNSRWERVEVVFVRPGFFWAPAQAKRANQLFPVLLVAGYESQPEHFAQGVTELDGLLPRIDFVPTPFEPDTPDILACAGGKPIVRLVITKAALVSPDLAQQPLQCVEKLLTDRYWPLHKDERSYIFRAGR